MITLRFGLLVGQKTVMVMGIFLIFANKAIN